MTIRFDFSDLEDGLSNLENRTAMAIRILAKQGAQKFENTAKNTAPWTDRSGRARGSLTGYVEEFPNKINIVIAHGVDYGIYLELCNEKRYAVIPDTLNKVSPEIEKSFVNFFNKL